jgi:drug/metabolite transporter (DMT)-like permease
VSAALSKVVLERMTPVDLFGIELVTGALVLGAVGLRRGARLRRPGAAVLLLGALEPGVTFLMFDAGIARTAASHAAVLLSTDSLFMVVLASLVLGERLDRRLAAALAAGSGGTTLVASHHGGMSSLLGDGLVIAASFTGASYGVLARRVVPGRDTLSLTAAQMLGGAAVGLPVVLAAGATGRSRLGEAGVLPVLLAVAIGMLSSVVPFLLYNSAIDRVTATAAGLVLTLVPVFGALTALIVLSDSLGPLQLGGCVLVLAAAATAAVHPEAETASPGSRSTAARLPR